MLNLNNNNKPSLNPAQKQAVEEINGPLLIIAGAGTGKTKTIVERIKHLIALGTKPQEILGITFTNKAAQEMRERVGLVLQENNIKNYPWLGTFHSLGVKILRDNKINFNIADRQDSIRYIKKILIEKNWNQNIEAKTILSLISNYKNSGINYEKFKIKQESLIKNWQAKIINEVWPEYENRLKQENNLDFDDLLLEAFLLLKNNEKIRKYYQDYWRYFHIDEYQDTNRIQYQIINLLTRKNNNICVVGDLDQSIYSWRGADSRNIINFNKDFPGAKTIILEENYRSTDKILNLADKIISVNKNRLEKKLRSQKKHSQPMKLLIGATENEEANKIITEIKKLLEKGIKPSEIAVLYRLNFQSRALEEAFLKANLPYQIIGISFFKRQEIKDLLSFIVAALNSNNWQAKERAILSSSRGIGKITLTKIANGQQDSLSPAMKTRVKEFENLLIKIKTISKNKTPAETLSEVFNLSGLKEKWLRLNSEEGRERINNIKELIIIAERRGKKGLEELQKFLDDISLASEQDELSTEGVRLMTIHSAKGLEFKIVFLSGLEEKLFPYEHFSDSHHDPEEERRLCYVAITRAKDNLFFSYALTRSIFGQQNLNNQSIFLEEIDNELELEIIDDKFKEGNAIEYLNYD